MPLIIRDFGKLNCFLKVCVSSYLEALKVKEDSYLKVHDVRSSKIENMRMSNLCLFR